MLGKIALSARMRTTAIGLFTDHDLVTFIWDLWRLFSRHQVNKALAWSKRWPGDRISERDGEQLALKHIDLPGRRRATKVA